VAWIALPLLKIPALAGKGDLLVVDRHSHNSIQEAAKIALANGAIVREMFPCRAEVLRDILEKEKPKGCVIAVDGVYSMSGQIPPLAELNDVAKEYAADLYIDDAHGTGVVGERGRGAAYQALGQLNDVLMVGSLSKAFSCLGGFVTCRGDGLKRILKIKSNTFIFGGPVPPPYLAGIIAVCDIIQSPEYDQILGNLHSLIARLTNGLRAMSLNVLGGDTSIVSVTVGDIEQTFKAGKWLFDRGFYVQSATYPAVPISGGLLRIQVNANHTEQQVDDLLNAIMDLKSVMKLPTVG
jgi:7-keto-8-aminopelargonate synthetase-like enzyme